MSRVFIVAHQLCNDNNNFTLSLIVTNTCTGTHHCLRQIGLALTLKLLECEEQRARSARVAAPYEAHLWKVKHQK